MNVNIYIETSFKGPAVKRAVGAWIVEYIERDGTPNTRGGLIYTDRTSENDLALCLIEKAFSILTKTCCAVVFTECGHVLRTMQNHWLARWRKNGWINGKGKLIRNAGAWNRCADLFDHHMTEWTDQWHTYRRCSAGSGRNWTWNTHLSMRRSWWRSGTHRSGGGQNENSRVTRGQGVYEIYCKLERRQGQHGEYYSGT